MDEFHATSALLDSPTGGFVGALFQACDKIFPMVKLFVSYAHRDEELRNQLGVHLEILRREGVIEPWHDRRIGAGRDVHAEISDSLESADLVLLLVSPDFLASDYCFDVEMKRALARSLEGTARVIPVILRPCDWQRSPFGSLRATPADGHPISKSADRDEAFLQVSRDIRSAAEEIGAARRRDDLSQRFLAIMASTFETEIGRQGRSKGRQASFTKLADGSFQASYIDDRDTPRSCTVWRDRHGDILYSPGMAPLAEKATETLSILIDSFGIPVLRTRGGKEMISLMAAGYLWQLFSGRAQAF
jgi:hypothetical protein